jgi:putative membrane protein
MLLETRIPFGYIARKAQRPAAVVLIISIVIELVLHFNRAYVPVVPATVPVFLGTAISLILAFELAQSYDRWWEARKIWGAIVNDSRTLVRQLLSFVPVAVDDEAAAAVRRMAHRQIAWCYCLGQSLRGLDWRARATEHLTHADVEDASNHANKPVALVQQHARDLTLLSDAGHLGEYRRVSLDDTLTRLTDSMGKAERIRNTVFPHTYRIFLHAFIYVFITLLAISLAEIDGAWQISITTSIAIPFFLLERTAKHMQDPFANRPTDTAMTSIARTIEINILQLLGEEPVPDPWPPDDFYLM